MMEIQPNEMCPCGRGRKYKKCCKKQGIIWYREEDGSYTQEYRALMPQEMIEVLKKSRDRFYALFGREPCDDDLVVFDAPRHSNSYYRSLIPALRKSGVPEKWIYAMYRTGGLMPTKENRKYISQHDLDAFAGYEKEYKGILREVKRAENGTLRDEPHIRVEALVMIGNEIVDAEIKKVAESLQHGFNYFLNCLNKDGGSIKAAPGSLAEYVFYIAIRSDNTIKSIVNLNGINEAGSIYALGRSLFESYVYLRAINCDASFFEVNVLPSLSFSECGIQIEDGAIKYKKIKVDYLFGEDVPKRNRRNEPKFGIACDKYGTDIDKKLKGIFYRYACQFVHIDPLTARSVFYEPDLYSEFSESSIATVCSLAMGVVLLEEIGKLAITPEQQGADIRFLAGSLAEHLCNCFGFFNLDDEQADEMYKVFLYRLLEVEGNCWGNHD